MNGTGRQLCTGGENLSVLASLSARCTSSGIPVVSCTTFVDATLPVASTVASSTTLPMLCPSVNESGTPDSSSAVALSGVQGSSLRTYFPCTHPAPPSASLT